jgi:hypothetical protein
MEGGDPISKKLAIETRIAREDQALEADILELGPPSPKGAENHERHRVTESGPCQSAGTLPPIGEGGGAMPGDRRADLHRA